MMMRRKNTVVWLAMLLLLCAVLPVKAQSYASLKKDIEANRNKDLPQSALKSVDKMISLAASKGDNGELLWALLTRGQLSNDISPDSAATLIPRIEQLLKVSKPEMQAVCHAVLGALYAAENTETEEAAPRKAVSHFVASMENPTLLASARVKDFLPFTIAGADSRYFKDDLLHVVSRFDCNRLSDMNNEVLSTDSLGMDMLQKAIREYRHAGNREAEFFLLLDSVDASERMPVYARHFSNRLQSQQADESKERCYRSLLERFGDLDVCAEVYLRLSREMGSHRAEAYKWAEEGVQRYPKSKKSNSLRNRLSELTQSQMSLSLPRNAIYPECRDSITITAVNTERAVLKFYSLDVAADAEILWKNNPEELRKAAKDVAFEVKVVMPAAKPYEEVHQKIPFVVSKAGIYLVRLESQDASSDDVGILYVSRLHLMRLYVPKEGQRILVSEAVSGRPVAGASLMVRALDQNRRVVKRLVTDENGTAMLSVPKSRCEVFAQTADDKYSRGLTTDGFYNDALSGVVAHQSLAIYTDRAIYRPGQKVQVGGFLYRQNGDEVNVCKGENVEIQLFDATHGKSIQKIDVTTDAFGGIHGEFKLPENCLNGQFHVSGNDGSAYFRVEQYKRPTFTVSFDEVKEAYQAGDTVRLHGTVKTYAGFPLPQTRVAVTTSRRYSPWCYFFYSRRNAEKVVQDTVMTDADGRFSVPVFLNVAAPDGDHVNWWLPRFYTYETEAVAISENGESETGSCNFFVGNRPAFLSTTLPAKVCKEQTSAFQVNQLNAGGNAIAGKAHFEILQGNEEKLSGEWNFNTEIQPTVLKDLPSGEYVLRVVPAERKDTLVLLKHDFVIFSLSDTHPVGKEKLQVYQTAGDFGSGEIRVHVATPEKNVYLHYVLSNAEGELENKLILLSDSAVTIPYTYQTSYGDGVQALFAFVRNGLIYTRSVMMEKPTPNKHLTLRWKTFRDRLRPGQSETWTLQVLREGKPVQASVLAALYDGSLDKFQKLSWPFSLNFYRNVPSRFWGMIYSRSISLSYAREVKLLNEADWQFSHFDEGLLNIESGGRDFMVSSTRLLKVPMMNAAVKRPMAFAAAKSRVGNAEVLMASDAATITADAATTTAGAETTTAEVKPRTDFSETAFFMPCLTTDANGETSIRFVLPQSLTQWNFKALAHTGEVDYGVLDTTAVASKDFMLQPNLPRFLRVGDETALAASLRNATDKLLRGNVFLELLDPATQKVVKSCKVPFSVEGKGETVVSFPVQATSEYPLLICRMTARSGAFSDGEQNYIPVLDDRQELTESVPLSLVGQGVKTADLTSLFGKNSPHATHRRLTVEYTGNPAWLAIEALPTMSRPICDDAVSMATAYYALSLAQQEAHADPAIEQLARAWQKSGSVDSVFLLLERNADLKQIVLSETPWVASADKERERLSGLAQLFDSVTLSYRLQSYEDKLLELQNADGSWSWFKGMRGSLWMTVDICETLSKLGRLSPAAIDGEMAARMQRAMKFMDSEVSREVEEMKKEERQNHLTPHVDGTLLRYLYICAEQGFQSSADRTYLVNLLEKDATSYNMYSKSLAVNVLAAAGRNKAAELTLKSLLEHTVSRPDMGRYFDTDRALWSWNSYRIPTQVAALDAVCTLTPHDSVTIWDMTRWLVQAKRTQTWDNPRSSVDAVFYLFLRQNMLKQAGGRNFPKITLTLTNRSKMDLTADAHELQMPATLGYFRRTLTQDDLKAAPAQLVVNKTAKPMAFGAVYAQYLVPSSEVKAAEAGLSLTCTYSVRRGQEWQTIADHAELQKGDLIRIRYELTADRDYDFVCLKEGRPACCEPVRALSGYDGLSGCYLAVGDASTQYFFEQLRKGKHVLETQMRADRSGSFSSAVPTVQCVYAPEFFGRAEAVKLHVK
jgi:hypothetical protein